MMKVEHTHKFPFMERMVLSGWVGPWLFMAAVAASKEEQAAAKAEKKENA